MEEISYKTLRKIEEIEKSSSVLSDIKSDFYSLIAKYLDELNERLKREESQQKKTILQDEIANIKRISSNIYEAREKKIVLAALSKARGGNPDTKNMIDCEKKLFDAILNALLSSRDSAFEIKEKESIKEKGTEEKEKKGVKEENKNPIVRIDRDLPEFIGTDKKKYYLKKDDIISLPRDMSNTLINRGAAEKLDDFA